MSLPHPRRHPQRPPWAMLLALVLALLAAQTLGLVHATLHGAVAHSAGVPVSAAPVHGAFGAWNWPHDCQEHGAHAPSAAHDPAAPGEAADAAFGHEAGSAECRLYDQLGHDWALAAPWALEADLPAAATAAARHAEAPIAAQAAGYLARGPPRRAATA